eukprot:PhM_4_TR6965/c0_g1_i1/m.15434
MMIRISGVFWVLSFLLFQSGKRCLRHPLQTNGTDSLRGLLQTARRRQVHVRVTLHVLHDRVRHLDRLLYPIKIVRNAHLTTRKVLLALGARHNVVVGLALKGTQLRINVTKRIAIRLVPKRTLWCPTQPFAVLRHGRLPCAQSLHNIFDGSTFRRQKIAHVFVQHPLLVGAVKEVRTKTLGLEILLDEGNAHFRDCADAHAERQLELALLLRHKSLVLLDGPNGVAVVVGGLHRALEQLPLLRDPDVQLSTHFGESFPLLSELDELQRRLLLTGAVLGEQRAEVALRLLQRQVRLLRVLRPGEEVAALFFQLHRRRMERVFVNNDLVPHRDQASVLGPELRSLLQDLRQVQRRRSRGPLGLVNGLICGRRGDGVAAVGERGHAFADLLQLPSQRLHRLRVLLGVVASLCFECLALFQYALIPLFGGFLQRDSVGLLCSECSELCVEACHFFRQCCEFVLQLLLCFCVCFQRCDLLSLELSRALFLHLVLQGLRLACRLFSDFLWRHLDLFTVEVVRTFPLRLARLFVHVPKLPFVSLAGPHGAGRLRAHRDRRVSLYLQSHAHVPCIELHRVNVLKNAANVNLQDVQTARARSRHTHIHRRVAHQGIRQFRGAFNRKRGDTGLLQRLQHRAAAQQLCPGPAQHAAAARQLLRRGNPKRRPHVAKKVPRRGLHGAVRHDHGIHVGVNLARI